jgi:hypothetical protein
MSADKASNQYEVLSPWADADSVPKKGITPRVTDLAGKTIGLFRNIKVSAGPILTVVEEKLKERFPTSKISWYLQPEAQFCEVETARKAKFEEWVRGVDAVITAVGD